MTLLFTIVTLIAILIAALGLYGLISPEGLAAFASRWRSKHGLWTAAAIRLVFGAALWLVAPYAHTPLVLKILAGLAVAAGVALPFLGLARFAAMLDWWSALPAGVQRAWSGLAACLGMFLLWAVAG